jgi:capsular exopolysaccharide synthesis family protein
VLGILVLVVGASVLRVFLSTPIYQATAMVQINPEARRILPGQEQWVGAESGSWLAEEFYFNTQLEVLKSRDLAERVFHRLHLQDHPRFAGGGDPIGAFSGSVIVRPKVNTRLVAVSMTGPDPQEITEWVNTFVEAYEQRNVDDATKAFNGIMDEIGRSLGEFRANMGQADIDNLESAASQSLFVPENQDEILKGNLQSYNAELTVNNIKIGKLEAEIQNLERAQASGEDVMALPRFSEDVNLAQLAGDKLALERDIERLSAEKRPQHPDHIAKTTELRKIEQKMAERASQIIEELRGQYALALSNAANLKAEIRRTEEGAHQVHQATAAYDLLRNDAESKRKVYEVVAETMNRFSLNAQLINMNNNVSILDKAIEPRFPIRPRKALTVAFGFLIGLLSGIAAVLFLDYLDNTIRSPEDIEQYLGLGMLAVIPRHRGQPSNAVREAFQSLRTGILFSSGNREKRVVLFSSAGPKEGKSSTVVQVARALASAGDRVIVVDCDLRRPTQHHHNNVPREPGLTNYLLDGRLGEYEPFIQRTDLANLSLFTCGPIPPNPPELVGTKKFADLLKDLKDSFDWVIVDSPPVANLADSVVLASLCDMMIMVIKHNENDRDLIRRCLKRLADVDVEVAGAVLNSVDVESSYYSRYYYGNYYYDSADDGKKKRGRLGRRSRSDAESTKVAL